MLVTSECLLKKMSKLSTLPRFSFFVTIRNKKTICYLVIDNLRTALLILYWNQSFWAHNLSLFLFEFSLSIFKIVPICDWVLQQQQQLTNRNSKPLIDPKTNFVCNMLTLYKVSDQNLEIFYLEFIWCILKMFSIACQPVILYTSWYNHKIFKPIWKKNIWKLNFYNYIAIERF